MIQKARWIAAGAMLMLLAACGGDDPPASGSNSGAVESCNRVCDKEAQKMCPNPFMVTVEECKQLCAAFVGSAPPACQAQIKTESDCKLNAADICNSDDACTTKADAGSACM